MIRSVDLCSLHQITGQAGIELLQQENGSHIEPGRQDQRPQVVIQTDLIEQHILGDDDGLGRDHHGNQHHNEDQISTLVIDFTEGIACHGGNDQLTHRTDAGNGQRVQIQLPKGHLFMRPNLDIVIPLDRIGNPLEIGGEDLVAQLQRGRQHPQQGHQKQKAAGCDPNRIDDPGDSIFLMHTLPPVINNGPIFSGPTSGSM